MMVGSDFRRDGPTVLSYSALVCYAFWLYGFGPALALLREQLHFSYTVLGVYSALWSAGAAASGALFAVAARRLSRSAMLWFSALIAVAGAGLFVVGSGIAWTMAGAAVLGLAGTTLLTVVQAVLSDRHGPWRDRALTEANVGAAGCAVLAPLALGALVGTPVGWGAAFVLPMLGLGALYLRFRGQLLPRASAPVRTQGPGRLPPACWLFAGLVAVGIAVEFCLVYFGAEQFTGTGLSTAAAATAMSCFYFGILTGRVGGAVLTGRPGRAAALLYWSLALAAVGFLAFWLTHVAVVAVVGVFVTGVGIANLYPLSMALTLGAASGNEDRANARTQLLGGLLVIAAPYLLGSLADRVGLRAAFALEPVLIGVCLVLLIAGLRVHSASRTGS